MKRWNGWGEESTHYPLPQPAARYLLEHVGEGCPAQDAGLEEVLSAILPSRLPAHPLVDTSTFERLSHARGQSLPDWIALRSGHIGAFPDGVAYPAASEDVRSLIAYAQKHDLILIPYGGGTSVAGHINPPSAGRPVLTVDLSRLNRLLDLDETSRLASFEAGVRGPDLERQLRERGFTLGHFPQSFEFSTLGGWIATRSSGQQSYYYGRIEDLFAGGHLETPLGPLDMPVFPASAAGPDLRQVVLGSEGRLGILTQASVRVQPLPAFEAFYGVFFRDWEAGAAAVREIAQAGVPVSMVRLSDPQESETTLALSGKENLVRWARRGLGLLGYGQSPCLLVFGVTGDEQSASWSRRAALAILRRHGGLFTGETIGRMWRKSRFLSPYLRNELWSHGYALDTLETALPWSGVLPAAAGIQAALREAFNSTAMAERGSRILVFGHLSHVYPDGASIYITYLYPRAAGPEETLQVWSVLKAAASRSVLANGGTISHQHGVGSDHAPYLPAEKGALGMRVLATAIETLDPQALLNPGKLIASPIVG